MRGRREDSQPDIHPPISRAKLLPSIQLSTAVIQAWDDLSECKKGPINLISPLYDKPNTARWMRFSASVNRCATSLHRHQMIVEQLAKIATGRTR